MKALKIILVIVIALAILYFSYIALIKKATVKEEVKTANPNILKKLQLKKKFKYNTAVMNEAIRPVDNQPLTNLIDLAEA